MRILAIETSCDETGIALLEVSGELSKPEVKVLGNTLYSQAKLHEEFGGVYPTLAKREHEKNLPPLLAKTLKEAGLAHKATAEGESEEAPNIDFIAVTTGPGLEPALWTGITFAQGLGQKWGKPVVGANHMEGHIFSILSNLQGSEKLDLPALALLVSGGHTELVDIQEFGSYKILGRTLDDAVGEAYDKVARMLGLTYPGGPKIGALAKSAREKGVRPEFTFPRPMINSKDRNFSFSGLKTAVLYKVKSAGREDTAFKEEVALAFDEAVLDVLVEKTRQVLLSQEVKSLVIAGGVAASEYLRERFQLLIQEFPGLKLYFPTKLLSTDNAIMIGLASFVRVTKHPELGRGEGELKASGNLELQSL